MLEHALAYASRGWRVFPVGGAKENPPASAQVDKWPRIKAWEKNATTNTDSPCHLLSSDRGTHNSFDAGCHVLLGLRERVLVGPHDKSLASFGREPDPHRASFADQAPHGGGVFMTGGSWQQQHGAFFQDSKRDEV